MTLHDSPIILSLGGIAFFLFGVTLLSKNLQKLAADHIRKLLSSAAKKPHLGLFTGVLLTVLIQSSGAFTSMLTSLGSAGVVSLQQVMVLILGSAIGTTITVQLLSFHITKWGLVIFTLAFFIHFSSKRSIIRWISASFMGLGMMFFGLEVIKLATKGLSENELFVLLLQSLTDSPLATILVTSGFTALAHSSAATLGLTLSFASAGLLTLEESLFWVYGANLGTTATAWLASLGGATMGKRIAWAHILLKLAGVCLFVLINIQFVYFIQWLSSFNFDFFPPNLPRQIANSHTLFNISIVILFYPFTKFAIKLVEVLIPSQPHEKVFSVKYIKKESFISNSVALAQAEREVQRMADITCRMLRESIGLFTGSAPNLAKQIKAMDNKLDILQKEVHLFLARMVEDAKASEQSHITYTLTFALDLESAGDVIDNNLKALGAKQQLLKLTLSKEATRDLKKFHKKVCKLADLSAVYFQKPESSLLHQTQKLQAEIFQLESDFRESHLGRIATGSKTSINISSIYLDILNGYRRIADLMLNHINQKQINIEMEIKEEEEIEGKDIED